MSKLVHSVPMLKPLLKLSSITALAVPLILPKGTIAMPGEPDLYCFQVLQNGQVVDLRQLCKNSPEVKPAVKPEVKSGQSIRIEPKAANKKVIIEPEVGRVFDFFNKSFDGSTFVGMVKNRTTDELRRAKITYVLLKQGNGSPTPIKSGYVYTDDGVIAKGATSSFTIETEKEGDTIQLKKVETK